MDVRFTRDLDEGERLWRRLSPGLDVFDDWAVRQAFQDSYRRPPLFLVAEEDWRPVGLLSLSWIAEEDYYGAFPGETWRGRTWLEQNRVLADDDRARRALWEAAPDETRLRYLDAQSAAALPEAEVDEVGYILRPGGFAHDYEAYWESFSGKSRKKIARAIEALGPMECRSRDGGRRDIEWMFATNTAGFAGTSYFEDPRFLAGFEAMLAHFSRRRMLRVVTLAIGGRRAAVDVAVAHRDRYTVLAGATDPEFPGVAKAINLFHVKWACRRRCERIDFLCGDFGWKERFHLEPRPLFAATRTAAVERAVAAAGRSA